VGQIPSSRVGPNGTCIKSVAVSNVSQAYYNKTELSDEW